MDIGLIEIMATTAIAIVAIGAVFIIRMYRDEKQRELFAYDEAGHASIDAHIEYDADNGGIYYIIQNRGKATAHDVRIYLPRCHEKASTKKGASCKVIAAGILKVMMKQYDRMAPGEMVEIPIVQIPPIEENRRAIYGMGFDAEIRWSNAKGDVSSKDFVLPVMSRIPRLHYQKSATYA